ncbi:CBO0543 family protein [Paenibacillus aurantiacus]|uniref:CBO0543 family protein n=1 Tax=Paenibacillus aurantiacus TaxID=1936118 RepID=A0ABV5KHL2_9BACL
MDTVILYGVWILTTILLIVFINRTNWIQAQISFLFMQVPSWLFGSLVVQGGLIEYPVGFLKIAYRASFTFEFFVFPAVSAIFNTYFPRKKHWVIKTLYILGIPGLMTAGEVYLEKHTELIKYLHWAWYWSYLTMTATLLLSYGYYLWFFRKVKIT